MCQRNSSDSTRWRAPSSALSSPNGGAKPIVTSFTGAQVHTTVLSSGAHQGPLSKLHRDAFASKDAAASAPTAPLPHGQTIAGKHSDNLQMLKSSRSRVRQWPYPEPDTLALTTPSEGHRRGAGEIAAPALASSRPLASAGQPPAVNPAPICFSDYVRDEPPFQFLQYTFAAPWYRPQLDLHSISLEDLKHLKNFLFFQVRHLGRRGLEAPPELIISKYEFEYAWRRRKDLPLHLKALQYERRAVIPARERMQASTNLIEIITPRYSHQAAALPATEDLLPELISAAATQLVEDNHTYKRQDGGGGTMPWLSPSAESPTPAEEINAWALWIAPSLAEVKVRGQAVDAIMMALQRRHRAARITTFGSGVTQTGEATADIDLNVSMPWLGGQPKNTFYAVAQALTPLATPGTLQVLHWVRTPIIKLRLQRYLDLEVDITINTPDGIRTTAVIAQLIEGCPLIRPVTLFLKKFLARRELQKAAKGGLCGFALTILVATALHSTADTDLALSLSRAVYVENICDPGKNCAQAINKWPSIIAALQEVEQKLSQAQSGRSLLTELVSYSPDELQHIKNFEALSSSNSSVPTGKLP
ncbi:hypothetical protein OC844_006167 [Tilletia horrida]|nr:hypothetical protein OC844_006167 [Tilletia horrida]